jgi:hypothetical protein
MMCKYLLSGAAVFALLAGHGQAQNWEQEDYLTHREYQAVNEQGAPLYTQGWPFRMVGVVLNDTEDWLDPTPGYHENLNDGVFDMGGQAEIFVQAVNLDGTEWDPSPQADFDDAGGTACWIGQNLGEVTGLVSSNYTDEHWLAELDRLGLAGGPNVPAGQAIRAGDLVEIRARAGLFYRGKFNVNEQHNPDEGKDFEIVRLRAGFGLPEAVELTLSDLKDADDAPLFDASAQFGPERYQATRVKLTGLTLAEDVAFASETDILVTDHIGRTFTLHTCLGEGFDDPELPVMGQTFTALGVLDQLAPRVGQWPNVTTDLTDGYRLLVMNGQDIQVVPEPASLLLLPAGLTVVMRRRRRRRMHV